MTDRSSRDLPHSKLFKGMTMIQRVQALKSELSAICEATPTVPDEALMFQLKHISEVNNPIAKLTRMIFYHLRLTEEEFYERHRLHKEAIGKSPGQINTDKGNLKKTVMAPRITIKQFERLMTMLNYDITNMTFEITDRHTGRSAEYKLSDVNKYIKDKQNTNLFDDIED